MHVYLPIAEIQASIPLLLAMGGGVGILSGLFGVGGGFLMTPLLLLYGIPPAVAVATEANQIMAASVSGSLAHWRRRALDPRMGLLLLIGGAAGAAAGVQLFRLLTLSGYAELTLSLSYAVLLSVMGALILLEALNATIKSRHGTPPPFRAPGHHHSWIHRLPLKVRFPRSALYTSVIPPIIIGAVVGLLAAVMGVGGGFLLIPAMIYVLKMHTSVVIGTSLFQIIFVTAIATVLHSVQNQAVDVVLALILICGGVVGAQIGASLSHKIRSEHMRFILAVIILAVAASLLFSLFSPSPNPFVVQTMPSP